MAKFKYSDFKKSSVYITPNLPILETKRYKVKLTTALSSMVGYTVGVMLLVILVLALTPAKEVLYLFGKSEIEEQALRITELESRVTFLTNELNDIVSTNKRLRYAMYLATNDSIDTLNPVYDSLKTGKEDSVPDIEGNIYYAFKKLLKNNIQDQKEKKKNIYFLSPSEGFIINNYDEEKGHLGIDFAAANGTPVYASSGGVIINAGYDFDDGYNITIMHPLNYVTVYKHLSVLLVNERDYVKRGMLIALSGNSGKNTTGPHLHFEIWDGGKAINPKNLLIDERR